MRSTNTILAILLLLLSQNLFSQRIWGKEDFCFKRNSENLIGQQVKIWSNGGIYTTINTSKSLKWPSEEIKEKSGENSWGDFYPQTGDTGTVVHVFEYDKGRVASAKIIYLIKIGINYVPIGCGYLTTIDKLDKHEEAEYWRIQDSVKNAEYAQGCKFKTSYVNGSYFNAGAHEIDKLAESFACELSQNGVDTILLIKSFYNNHGLGNSKFEGISWTEKGESYLKVFRNMENEISENESIKIDLTEIQSYFEQNKIESDTTYPQPTMWISHDLTFYIQFKQGSKYYTESLTNSELTGDTKHIKSVWVSMILKEINKSP